MSGEAAPKPSILLTAAICLTSFVTLLCAWIVFWAGQYLLWVATRGDAIDIWTVLTVVEVACALGGAVGAWLLIRRGRPGRALLLLPLPFAGSFLVEANRCDVLPACAWAGWASLPKGAFEWRLPLRDSPEANLGRRGPDRSRSNHVLKALDGDTLLFDGKVVRIAGIDAPELGQTAKCWAEAALGGESRNALEAAISAPGAPDWELAEASRLDASGRITANLVTKDGDDLRDRMIVNGFAARTDGRWNWCGPDPNLHSPSEDEAPPHGPNMWLPAEHIYDVRAVD